DWAAGEHKLTAEYAGNNELGGSSTTNEVTVTVNESYAVYDGSKFCAATAESPKVPTTTEISDRNTINNLYIMGASVPKNLMGDPNSDDNTNLKTVTCADSVTSIGENAFAYCTILASVDVSKVTTIGNLAFLGCAKLTSVAMPSATTIGVKAFMSCARLKSVAMPKVTTIGDSAFNDCTALASLTLGATPPTVGTDAFYKCSKTDALTIQGNSAYQTEVLAAYKAVNDGATDELWYGWTLPNSLDGSGVSNSAGTLKITTGNAAPIFGAENAITLTATFDKAAKIGKQRTLTINQVEFKDGTTSLKTVAAIQNTDGKWVATLDVNTKDWAAGTHNLTATFAGNHELGDATATLTITVGKSGTT
ncbi:MAG: leucine-rich repeat domain-containing protein, partial [Angelakisella sp.]